MYIFVYGTLKVGGHFAGDFNHVRNASIPATLNGYCLYNLGWFPTIKAEEGQVVGEAHDYKDGVGVLRSFDGIEGYNVDTDSGLYLRREVEVVTEDGGTVKAWAYILNSALPPDAKKIESGVWKLKGMQA